MRQQRKKFGEKGELEEKMVKAVGADGGGERAGKVRDRMLCCGQEAA